MNIPKTVRVGSMIYQVLRSDKTLILDGKECKGMIQYETHIIELNNVVQDIQGEEQTFLHELVHAIVRERNVSLDNGNQELVVDEIATGLHQVIKDNPKIFKEN